jgi:plasmid stabilization system protein ParE
MSVFLSKFAENSIRKIGFYISEEGYPNNAINYILRLQQFINSLGLLPRKLSLCKQLHFSKRNFHCAVFEKTYIVVFKIKPEGVYVYNIIHGSRLKQK